MNIGNWQYLFFVLLISCKIVVDDETGPQFPQRTGFQVAELDGNLFRIGGMKPQPTSTKYFTDIQRSRDGYRWEVLQANNLPAKCLKRKNFVVQAFQDKLYFLGGIASCVYTSQNGTDWQPGQSLPPGFDARTNHVAAVFQNKLLLFGGQKENSTRFLGDVWSFGGTSWREETITAPFSVRSDHQAVVLKSQLYLIGGLTNNRGAVANNAYRSTDALSYAQIRHKDAFARAGHQSVVFDNQILIIGGYKGSQKTRTLTYKKDVWASADGTTWKKLTEIENLPEEKYAFQAVVFQNKVFLIGATITWDSADGTLWQSQWQQKQ